MYMTFPVLEKSYTMTLPVLEESSLHNSSCFGRAIHPITLPVLEEDIPTHDFAGFVWESHMHMILLVSEE
jgi:hypothetical protein